MLHQVRPKPNFRLIWQKRTFLKRWRAEFLTFLSNNKYPHTSRWEENPLKVYNNMHWSTEKRGGNAREAAFYLSVSNLFGYLKIIARYSCAKILLCIHLRNGRADGQTPMPKCQGFLLLMLETFMIISFVIPPFRAAITSLAEVCS